MPTIRDLFAPVLDETQALLDDAQETITLLRATAESQETLITALRARVTELEAELPPTHQVLIGAAYGSNTDPTPLEDRLGAKVQTRVTFFTATQVAKAAAVIRADIAAGRVPFVSFKLPGTWGDVAAGKHDTWLASTAATLNAAAEGGHALVVLHHEPENDFPKDATTDQKIAWTQVNQPTWTAMQVRAAGIFRPHANLRFGPVLMGYHSMPGATLHPWWRLENCIPDALVDLIDFIGWDVYQETNSPADRIAKHLQVLADFCKPRSLDFGLRETGITPEAFTRNPTWFADLHTTGQNLGAAWLCYFNTALNNNNGSWVLNPGDPREQAFGALLKAVAGGAR